jgi:lipid A ethanolaminephosphotransferase
LGENGIYPHGLPYSIASEEKIKAPMILWMSEGMKASDHMDYE